MSRTAEIRVRCITDNKILCIWSVFLENLIEHIQHFPPDELFLFRFSSPGLNSVASRKAHLEKVCFDRMDQILGRNA